MSHLEPSEAGAGAGLSPGLPWSSVFALPCAAGRAGRYEESVAFEINGEGRGRMMGNTGCGIRWLWWLWDCEPTTEPRFSPVPTGGDHNA